MQLPALALLAALALPWCATAQDAAPFPKSMETTVQPVYRQRPDGQPGREIHLDFAAAALRGPARVEVAVNGRPAETVPLPDPAAGGGLRLLLPPGVGVREPAQVTLTLRQGGQSVTTTVEVPAMRQWTVYLYNHAHVDIGYTTTADIAEFIHTRNLEEGIKLAEATKDYPPGARYRWNPEVTWPLERLWQTASAGHKQRVLTAIHDGQLCVDASYVHLSTSGCADEELFQALRFSRELRELTGAPLDTFQQMDVPGMTWGLVPVLAQEGVRHVMVWPNTCRAGHAHEGIDNLPFWWLGPDGKSKVLFLQPGCYGNSGSTDKGKATGRPWFGQRDRAKIPAVIQTGSANVDFTQKLSALEKGKFPYDFLVLSWSLWDNCPLDADVPAAVKAWNEQHAFPHLVIAGGHEIMSAIEQQVGAKLPVVSGDFTEYWTDGMGTAARLTAGNRNAKEQLVQAETLWTMLRPGQPAPRAAFDEAWRFIALGSEHTWTAENPNEPFYQDALWKTKQGYFREAAERTQCLFDDALAPATDRSEGALGPPDGPAQGGVAVFNTHSWPHGGLVVLTKAESARGERVTDAAGRDVPAQRLSTGELAFLAGDVPAFGSRHFRVVAGTNQLDNGCEVRGTTLDNRLLRVTLDPATGNITELIDRATGKNFADAKVNGGLNAFRWLPGDSDLAQADTAITLTTVEAGPLVVEVRVTSQARGCRSVSRAVRLVRGQPWLELTNVVDKLPLAAKDGVHFGFGFDLPGALTRVDIPWGVVEVDKDQWPAANRNWLTLQRWLDLSNDKDGVTWCSLDAPLFESGGLTANQTGDWSKERQPWLRKLAPSSTLYSWVMNNHWFTNFPLTQDGPVTFRYRILPHGRYSAAAANRFGMEQSQPLAHVAANTDPALKPLLALDNERISISILKPLADGKSFIVRLRSLSDQDETARLSWPANRPQRVAVCPLNEQPGEAIGDLITLPARGQLTLRASW